MASVSSSERRRDGPFALRADQLGDLAVNQLEDLRLAQLRTGPGPPEPRRRAAYDQTSRNPFQVDITAVYTSVLDIACESAADTPRDQRDFSLISASFDSCTTVPTAMASAIAALIHISTMRQSRGPLRLDWMVDHRPTRRADHGAVEDELAHPLPFARCSPRRRVPSAEYAVGYSRTSRRARRERERDAHSDRRRCAARARRRSRSRPASCPLAEAAELWERVWPILLFVVAVTVVTELAARGRAVHGDRAVDGALGARPRLVAVAAGRAVRDGCRPSSCRWTRPRCC